MRYKYKEFLEKDLPLRDLLAIDRTILANERTLLAYIRTSLSFVVAGISIIKFFNLPLRNILGNLLIFIGVIIFIIGIYRFLKFRKFIRL